jgi:glycosyltransferase involved in cell wall biosynthesis
VATLAALRDRVHLKAFPPGRAPRGRVDVWLADGHAGDPHVLAPVVAVVHEADWTPAQLRGLDDSGGSQPLASQTAAGVSAASHVIAPSESSRSQVIENCGVAPERAHKVAYGVDTAVFRPTAAGGRALVARHSGSVERPYVLFVGSLLPRKNLAALRDAVGRLAARGYPHALAVVAREPAYLRGRFPTQHRRDAAAELPGAPGRVVMIPPLADAELASLMAGADAFCLPSLGEGYGLPALEAMACGTVVVVSDRGPLPEVVGDAGLVVAPTADALEEALRPVLGRPEDFAPLRRRAVASAEQRSWDRTADGWAHVLTIAAEEAPLRNGSPSPTVRGRALSAAIATRLRASLRRSSRGGPGGA